MTVSFACSCCGELITEASQEASRKHGEYQGRLREALDGKGHYVSVGERKVIRKAKAYKGTQKKELRY